MPPAHPAWTWATVARAAAVICPVRCRAVWSKRVMALTTVRAAAASRAFGVVAAIADPPSRVSAITPAAIPLSGKHLIRIPAPSLSRQQIP